MTSQEFRAAVISEIQTWAASNFPTMPVLHENGPTPDEDKIGSIWLDVEVRWYSGSIAAFGVVPRTRMTGAVSAMCFYKQGQGTDAPDKVIDSFSAYMQARRLGAGVLEAPQRTVPTGIRGWYKVGVFIPFTLG